MHSDYRSMAFLLSLGALPIACNNDEKDDGTAAGTTSTTMSTTPATTGTTGDGPTTTTGPTSPTESGTPTSSTDPTADPTPGTATESTSPTNPTESTTFLSTGTDTDADTTQEATDGLPPTDDPTCLAYAAKLTDCFPRYADYRQLTANYCAYYKMTGLAGDGQGCLDALEAQYVCLSQLDCAAFENEPCAPEKAAAETACPMLNSSETDSGGFGDTGSDT